MAHFDRELLPSDFAYMFGKRNVRELPDIVRCHIVDGDWRYDVLEGRARDAVICDILRYLDSDTLTVAGKKERWDVGWQESLEEFQKRPSMQALVPKYIRARQPVRILGDFAQPRDALFEEEWYKVFRLWLYYRFLDDYDTVYEFGCGTGHNLVAFSGMRPIRGKTHKRYVGLDWSQPAIDLVGIASGRYCDRISGRLFDFFHPDPDLELAENSVVLTIGALEQTGQRYEAFLQWLLERKPALCVFVEPIIEWYDPTRLVDYTAIHYLKRRGYWSGFPTRMAQLCAEGKVEIISKQRTEIGSKFLEGYMVFAWRSL